MAPTIVAAKALVSVPLYTCDFDPLEPTRLIVGGGGGASNSGVGNKIIVFDASKPRELTLAAEAELSKNEDNPTSLAVGNNHFIYAGLNSGPHDIAEGKNRHFRVYEIQNVGREEKKGANSESSELKIFERSKCSLFSGNDKDSYQRITRLSRVLPEYQTQLGVVATGLAQNHEIIFFETNGSDPPRTRGVLQIEKEAVDVDIFQTDKKEFIFAYCDEYSIYTKRVAPEMECEELQCVYKNEPLVNNNKARIPSLRSIRWLVHDHILALTNSQSGVILSIIKLSLERAVRRQVVNSVRLPRRLKKATGLCLANLSLPEISVKAKGCTQFVIAVAGHDRSLFLFTVDAKLDTGISKFSALTPFRTFQNVHPLQITSLAFSGLFRVNGPAKSNMIPPPLRLASVGISNTVVVHTLPLFPIPSSTQNGQEKYIRYVVVLPSRTRTKVLLLGISIMAVLFAGILIQGLINQNSSVLLKTQVRDRNGVQE
ncbi:putative guanine nucleotide exchange factor-like protein [Erysiphe neolycopersici]|uniref:Guanine nucleotide-exchange factor SEC12 n=1 Tax=Erysiphe neolycopersici TaxID=212602 RepID=A0A420HNV9_9PEZI|nr:putative guanine nucleotide exchange factor-like protein [Erysiphe neolycopersici]